MAQGTRSKVSLNFNALSASDLSDLNESNDKLSQRLAFLEAHYSLTCKSDTLTFRKIVLLGILPIVSHNNSVIFSTTCGYLYPKSIRNPHSHY